MLQLTVARRWPMRLDHLSLFCRAQHTSSSILSNVRRDDTPLTAYNRLVKDGILTHEPKQAAAMTQLERVHRDLLKRQQDASRGWFSKLIYSKADPVQGLYMYGGVGCGKTLLCDIFFACAPVEKKRRSHFHSFMLEVHAHLHELKKGGNRRPDVAAVAEDIVAKNGMLFCFDEVQVTDVADAMILRTLFQKMFELGAVLVSTSNRPPKDLYKNGLQREAFVPCIKDIEVHCEVYDMDTTTDFRLLGHLRDSTYMVTSNVPDADNRLEKAYDELTAGWTTRPVRLMTQGREVIVPAAAKGVAKFKFGDLCSRPLGAADYLAISRAFHTVIIKDIPQFTFERLTETRRFINLIDVLYDTKVKILCSAAAPPFQLMAVDKGAVHDEVFSFDRTASRLNDMQSEEYMRLMHQPPVSDDQDVLPELRVSELMEDDLEDIWTKYDEDHNGVIDETELRHLLEDISMAKSGHRNVDEDTVKEALVRLDVNKDGVVQKEEFKTLCAANGVGAWYI